MSFDTIASTYNAVSKLMGVNDADATYQYTYDPNGRLTTINSTGTSGTPSVLLTYTYDAAGNLTSVVDAVSGQTTGGTTAYAYSVLNQVTQITQSGSGVQSKRVNLGYNALGEMVSINRYADTTGSNLVASTSYTYDTLNRLTQLQHTRANGSNLASYSYGYDAASRLTQLTESNISATNYVTNYNYDATNQLSGADKPGTVADESYSYDANGNRLQTGYSTGSNNQLLSDGVYTYTYDNEGNLKTRTEMANANNVRTFTWDYRNRLTSVVDTVNGVTQQTTYTYDALNQRIAKTVGAQTTRFVYDRGNVYLEFSGTNTTPSTRYLYGPMVDQVLAQEASNNTTWLLTDHLGSVRDLVNNSGTVVNHFTYGAFGNVIGSLSGATADTRYKFTGREFDAETELYYYRARYYDANDGRFIGQDPLSFAAGDSNLYRYVGNNPTNLVDPSGLFGTVKNQNRYIQYIDGGRDIPFLGRIGEIEQVSVYPYATIPQQIRSKVDAFAPAPRTSARTPQQQVDQNIAGLNALAGRFYKPNDEPLIDKIKGKVLRDETVATIEWYDKPGGSSRATPWGGLYRNPLGDDQKGHIVPRELGGSTQKFNFFSQNASVNVGGYRRIGEVIKDYLDDLCKRSPQCNPAKPKVELRIELIHKANKAISGYPLRPGEISVSAVFSDGKHLTGWADNEYGKSSIPGVTWRFDGPK